MIILKQSSIIMSLLSTVPGLHTVFSIWSVHHIPTLLRETLDLYHVDKGIENGSSCAGERGFALVGAVTLDVSVKLLTLHFLHLSHGIHDSSYLVRIQ